MKRNLLWYPGFLKLATGRKYVPTWPDFDDGAVSRTGTDFRAPAVVPLVDGTGRRELYFHPLCSQTSATVLRYVPVVFARV